MTENDMRIRALLPTGHRHCDRRCRILRVAYEPQGKWESGVDLGWYMQKADPHWTEAAIRLTADEILRIWKTQETANRPFSEELMAVYSKPDGER